MARHTKRGVKRAHTIIHGFVSKLEQIAQLPHVKKVIPGRIERTKILPSKIFLSIQRETRSGFRLLAHGKSQIQGIFVVVKDSKKEEARRELLNLDFIKERQN